MATDKPPQPLDFPQCPRCPYFTTGWSSLCFACTRKTFATVGPQCSLCARPLTADGCGNYVCSWSDNDRGFGKISAITMKSGTIDTLLRRFKYQKEYLGWRPILGRIVMGWLEVNTRPDDYDLIIANPTHESREIRHIEEIVLYATREDVLGRWPFDVGTPRALIKTNPTAQGAGSTWKEKKIAADHLFGVLHVPDVRRTKGKRILVIDDFNTTSLQMRAVARALRFKGGAAHVDGLVIARSLPR